MISYYDLLEMVQDDEAPRKLRVHLTSNPREYEAVDDVDGFCYYSLIGEPDDDYRSYLSESYVESCMFDDNIEIIEDVEIEKISKDYKISSMTIGGEKAYNMDEIAKMMQDMYEKIDEIVDYINTHCKD